MEKLEQLYHLYDAYLEKAKEVRKQASRFAGAFGLGDDPRNHGCHEAFYDAVGLWCREFGGEGPDARQMAQAVSWILMAAKDHRNTDVYGYLYAAQGHVRELIPRLSREDSLKLLEQYDAAYPEDQRLPVQLEVYRLLKKQAGAGNTPAGRLRKLFRKG